MLGIKTSQMNPNFPISVPSAKQCLKRLNKSLAHDGKIENGEYGISYKFINDAVSFPELVIPATIFFADLRGFMYDKQL